MPRWPNTKRFMSRIQTATICFNSDPQLTAVSNSLTSVSRSRLWPLESQERLRSSNVHCSAAVHACTRGLGVWTLCGSTLFSTFFPFAFGSVPALFATGSMVFHLNPRDWMKGSEQTGSPQVSTMFRDTRASRGPCFRQPQPWRVECPSLPAPKPKCSPGTKHSFSVFAVRLKCPVLVLAP